VNEEHLKKILTVEEKAQAAYDQAALEASILPAQAEARVRSLLDQAREEANAEAARMIEQSIDPQIFDGMLKENAQEVQQKEALAAANKTQAIDYVIGSLLGKPKDHD